MSRSVAWRRAVSDACNWHQTQALESTIYILRQTGPTGFLLKEEGERKNVKVFMGDPHTCTCPVFKKERDLCKHICWLLLKKFRLSVNDPLSWQLGLVEREINEILRGRVTAERPQRQSQIKTSSTNQVINGKPVVEQREIAEEDVCPICQDELLAKKLPVTYCKFACGNSIHIKCMQVWAEHQQKSSPEGTIKCPMCREDFGPIEMLKAEMRNSGARPDPPPGIRMDRHLGVMCSNCSKAPIEGKCYRCMVCPTFHLCQRCFNFPIHTTHSFQFRQKRNQRWRSAPRTLGSGLPDALVNDLMQRDITENDYDLLLQMERNQQAELSNLTEDDLQTIPLERVREGGPLLSLGVQCRICLRGFSVGQKVRKLPCKHRFHQDCVDSWLLHSHPTCPIDGLQVVVPRDSSDTTHTGSRTGSASHIVNNNHQEASDSGGLTLTAMGIPVSASRLHRVNNGQAASDSRLVRRQAEPIPGSRLSGAGLELLGVGVTLGSGEGGTEAIENRIGNTSVIPGRRLLQQVGHNRRRLTSRLLRGNHGAAPASGIVDLPDLDVSTLSTWGTGTQATQATPHGNLAATGVSAAAQQLAPAALVNLLQSDAVLGGLDADQEARRGGLGERRPSLGSRGSVQSESDAANVVGRTSGRLRRRPRAQGSNTLHRPVSAERLGIHENSLVPRKETQNIFLGNNPQSQPALREGSGLYHQRARPGVNTRTRLFRSVFSNQSNQSTPSIQPSRPGGSNMCLEGNNFLDHDGENPSQ